MIKIMGWILILILLPFGIVNAVPNDLEKGGTIGEGYTSENADEGMSAAYRMFSGGDLEESCGKGPPAAKFVIHNKSPIIVQVGKRFPLYHIRVVAYDRSNRSLPPEPVSIVISNEGDHIFNLRADMIDKAELLAIHPGRSRIYISSLCGEAWAGIEVKVVPRVKTPSKKDKNGGG